MKYDFIILYDKLLLVIKIKCKNVYNIFISPKKF